MPDPFLWVVPLAVLMLTALAGKLNLPLIYGILGGLVMGCLSGVCLLTVMQIFHPHWILKGAIAVACIAGMTLAWILFRFFRDPERRIPDSTGIIVSPADGRIRYIHEIFGGKVPLADKKGRQFELNELTRTDLLDNDGMHIGIEMRVLDVHVNRAPVSGRICMARAGHGHFLSLRDTDSLIRNERVTTVIQHGAWQVGVVQIASRLVRRIHSYVREGQSVKRGQRIGMISFGSQVDVILPRLADLNILVKPGEFVRAGSTILARFNGE